MRPGTAIVEFVNPPGGPESTLWSEASEADPAAFDALIERLRIALGEFGERAAYWATIVDSKECMGRIKRIKHIMRITGINFWCKVLVYRLLVVHGDPLLMALTQVRRALTLAGSAHPPVPANRIVHTSARMWCGPNSAGRTSMARGVAAV
jgi:hypothetical protein